MGNQKSRDEVLESINWRMPFTGTATPRCATCGHLGTGTLHCTVLERDTQREATCDQHTALPDLAE